MVSSQRDHAMQEVLLIESPQQALPLLKPLRLQILQRMAEPTTCPELGEHFNLTPQKIYYHVKALEKAGLVNRVGERQVRGAVEGHYQAAARSYWLSPHLVGQIGGSDQARDQASLRFLLTLAEEVHSDIGHLGMQSEAGARVPSLGLDAQIHLPDFGRRAEFLAEVQDLFQGLAEKYGLADHRAAAEGETFRLVLAAYPAQILPSTNP
jgi:predicted ArsR family transcriptional regulator